MKKTTFTLVLMLCITFLMNAQQEFWYEGIHYRAIDYYSVEVISANDSIYSGRIIIPRYVLYETVDTQGVAHTEEFEVKALADSAFFRCSNLTGIVLPKSLERIGDYAFYYCTGLTSVDLPNSVKSIGLRALPA